MNRMLDRQRDRRSRAAFAPGRRRHRPAFEPLEDREVRASLGSFFSGLFPTFTSTDTTNATTKQQNKILRTPTNVSFPPYNITATISPASDPNQTGVVFDSGTFVTGKAPAYSTVWLAYGPLGYFNTVTRAGPDGTYIFAASIPKGTTELRIFAEAPSQAYSNVATLRVTNADPIVAWDAIAQRLIQEDFLSPEEASHDLAILHTAQYDAVVAATGQGQPYAVNASAAPGTSPEVAATYAASTVLNAIFPYHGAELAVDLLVATVNFKNNDSYRLGAALGEDVAKRTLALRLDDNALSIGTVHAIPNPNWGEVTPFALNSGSQFRPPAPPAPGSSAFDQALAEVTTLGRDVSPTRTADQTVAAGFWDDNLGTSSNVGHWNTIAQQVAVARKSSLVTNARTFAMLDVALADAAIAADDARTAYNKARPQATIRATTDPTWAPLLTGSPLLPGAPPTPSYVSEHAAYGAAAATVLASAFGKSAPFTVRATTSTPNPTRSFASFAAAATEEANSRVYGGVNYRFDVTAGSTLGTQVANVALARFKPA